VSLGEDEPVPILVKGVVPPDVHYLEEQEKADLNPREGATLMARLGAIGHLYYISPYLEGFLSEIFQLVGVHSVILQVYGEYPSHGHPYNTFVMKADVGIEGKLHSYVSHLMKEIEDAEAVLFATRDGLPVSFEVRFNPGIVERLAALSAMLFSVSRKASDIVDMGDMNYMEVDLQAGKLFMYRVNDDLFLAILTSPETNVGLVRLLARETVSKAREAL